MSAVLIAIGCLMIAPAVVVVSFVIIKDLIEMARDAIGGDGNAALCLFSLISFVGGALIAMGVGVAAANAASRAANVQIESQEDL